jgi:hypothetical protein
MTKSLTFRNALLGLLAVAAAFQLAVVARPAQAQLNSDDPIRVLESTKLDSAPAGESAKRLPIVVGNIIRVALSLLGIIVLCLIVYAGFVWMTAAGDSKKVDTAKSILKNAIIGAIILFLAYAISSFVIGAIQKATTE